ncbi:MAG TPA: ABC transporter substrate-binding protein, partial [Candidatus Limnocylindrales bacterium]|nr:ABC transporter substrate-binding protein [Candidatus Limnocylindrales bacterium]
MGANETKLNRRRFLQQSAALGLGALIPPVLPRTARGASKDRVVIYQGVSLDSLHPYGYSGGGINGIWIHMIEPLIVMDYRRKDYVGVLAESWEFQGKRWVFQLRNNIRFHNGAPFTSKDVAYSIERMKTDKRSLQGGDIADLEVETPDDFTVIFTTTQPHALLLDRLDTRYIISKAADERYGDQADNYAIGTGPYKFVSWQRGGNLVLARNDEYWGKKAEIKEVILKGVKEEAARVAGLLAGQADVISNLPIEEIDRVANHPRTRVEKIPGFRMYFLAMNVTFKPFENKLVRQAINHAIDPALLLKHIFAGNGEALNGPLAANMTGFDPGIKRYAYDPKKARELLAKAGYPNGLELKLHFSPDRHLKGREVCEVIANQLGKVGVKIELVGQEYAVYWGKDGVNGGKLPFYYAGRTASDADTFYDQYFHTGITKRVGYSNPAVDKLIEEQQRTADQKKRVTILQQAGRILMEDAPF